MTTQRENGQASGQKLEDVVKEADEYYNNLRTKEVRSTRLDVLVVGLLVWFSSFAAIGLTSLLVLGKDLYFIALSFLAAIVIGVGAGLGWYLIRRKKGTGFAEFGALLAKMKQGPISTEDALRLMDAMHQAAAEVKKRKVGREAFEYGLVAFVLVAIIGLSASAGAVAAVVVYLYFRFEALRDYERAEQRYEESKKDILLSM